MESAKWYYTQMNANEKKVNETWLRGYGVVADIAGRSVCVSFILVFLIKLYLSNDYMTLSDIGRNNYLFIYCGA